ncbi:MAG: PAS domain-containing sensor histidine kinase [Microbacterium sp.]|uniref:sensor histidine kinase n=1 Tax=Microbacterium sp. TaxID=51671 RepID=UPI0039E2F049
MGAAGSVSAAPAPSADLSRTRSIWLSQLLLAAVVVIVALVVQTLAPSQFVHWTFSAGVAGVVGVTALTLVLPWALLPQRAVLALPLLDIVAIGFLQYSGGLYTSFLWVFPVVWIATRFSAAAIATAGGLVGLSLLVEVFLDRSDESMFATVIIVLLSLAFLAMSTAISARQTRAFKTLLRRQAHTLQATVSRVRAQERRVTLTLDALDTGIVRISEAGDVLAVNDTYLALYGLDAAAPAAPGTSVEYATLRGDPLTGRQRPFVRAAAGEVFEQDRVWLFDAVGTWHALSVSSRALPAVDGEEASTLLLVHDVTALIESERKRERISAVVSHELRNPLTAIIGHAELLLEEEDIPERVREQLRVVDSAAQRMQHLIDDILRDRGAADQAQEEVTVDLGRIVSASVESFLPAAQTAHVAVTTDVPAGLRVVGDGFRLRQVVDNLLSNAIKYSDRGGAVGIHGRVEAGTVRVSIADDGLGIGPQDLPHVFEPYFRAETARRSGVAGTGLGMGIAQSLVAAHGGRLDIDSEPGVGTTVTVSLPAAARAVSPPS